MEQQSFECPKCHNAVCETGEIRASGGGISAYLNMENKKFATVTCNQCGYTEFYRGNVSGLAKLFDFLGG